MNKNFPDKWDNAKDKVTIKLINTNLNQALLAAYVHRDLIELGLSITYVLKTRKGLSEEISKDVLDMWGITEEDLYSAALDTVRNDVYVIPLESLLGTISLTKPFSYCVTNRYEKFGASSILLDEVREVIAKKLGGDYYIVPSSVHEMIAMRSENATPEGLLELVKEVNGMLHAGEFLAESVYYCTSNKMVKVA